MTAKTILVTGASYGLGVEIAVGIAKALVQTGNSKPSLLLVARNENGLRETAMRVQAAGGLTEIMVTDLTDLSAVDALAARVATRFPALDCFVSCAALSPFGLFEEHDPAALKDLLSVNLLAPLLIARALIPAMINRHAGSIVLISSMAGKYGLPFNAAYSASKSGLIEWTKAMRSELKDTGVDVRVICPMSVSRIGVSARSTQRTPWILGEVSPEQLVKAVNDAIFHRGPFERIVSSRPIRPLLALDALLPSAGPTILRLLGITKMYAAVAHSSRSIK